MDSSPDTDVYSLPDLPWLGVASRHSRQVNGYNYLNIMRINQNPVRDYCSVEKENAYV